MTYLGRITLIALFAFTPLLTHAAEPQLRADLQSDVRAVKVYYRNIPERSSFVITNQMDKEIRTPVRIQKENGNKKLTLPKSMPIGTYTITALSHDKKEIAEASFSVTYDDVPVCKLRASEKKVEKGETIRLRWTSKDADNVTLFNGFASGTHGSIGVSLNHAGPHTYTAKAVGKGGMSTCSATVRVQ